MPHFETFKKSSVPFAKDPHVTIQKRGTVTINAAAYAALGEPDAVELLFDRDEQVLGLRRSRTDVPHAAFVRRSTRAPSGPWVISAMAFVHFYEIDTSQARRWSAWLDQGTLCIRLTDPAEVVSRASDRPERRPRPRPRPARGPRFAGDVAES